jgi:hypothetical protein
MNETTELQPLGIQAVAIDADCVGERWETLNQDQLARLIVMIIMGQAAYAGHIIRTLAPAEPLVSDAQLRGEARIKLTVEEPAKNPRGGYPRWQRDGLIFEAISWIAARQLNGTALVSVPHVSSTSQGLDGLMIELSGDKSAIERTTIFEDKCTENPRSMFTGKVMPGFHKRHRNERSAEMISAAVSLIMQAGLDEVTATRFAAAITDHGNRRYRAAFAVTQDSQEDRAQLFGGYNDLENIKQDQRVGACFIVPPDLRDWFDQLAASALAYLHSLDEGL